MKKKKVMSVVLAAIMTVHQRSLTVKKGNR